LNFSIRYCHDGSTGTAACDGDDAEGNIQGSQDVEIFNYSSSAWQDIGDLRTNDNGFEVFDSFYLNGNLSDYVSSSATISLRYEINYYNEGNADSYLVIDSAIMNMTASTQLEYPTVVAKYDADSKPAIVYWNYGAGKVFYFGDFQVEPSKQNAYSEMLADLIERAYFVTVTPAKGEISCSYTGELFTIGQFSRNIEIKNLDNKVHITQK
ncbi:hypothetical protein JXC34_07370, partial [Candidatus Woesearchaeota archaeon]|nr:hypothetical protein [Candidatus Woesearchaeota archaeon]